MNPIERTLRRADRYQQRHGWLGFLFAVLKKFGDDKGGNLTTLLAWNGFFALFPLLLILVTMLGFLLGHHPALEQRLLHSTLAEFPIIGNQIQDNIHSLRANGLGLVVGLAGFLWGARGITQAGQHAMAEIWNIPGKQRPSFATRQLRGLLLLLVFGLGVVATTALASLASFGHHTLLFGLGNLAASAAVNAALFLVAFRVLTPRQVPTGQLLLGAAVAGVLFALLQAAGGYLVGHNLKHAQQVYGFFAIVLGLMSWLYLSAEVTLYGAEVNVVRARRLWPRSILQPPLTEADQRALIHLAKQEERRPEEAINVEFTPQAGDLDADGHARQHSRPAPAGWRAQNAHPVLPSRRPAETEGQDLSDLCSRQQAGRPGRRDLTCANDTRQHVMDDCPLSGNQLGPPDGRPAGRSRPRHFPVPVVWRGPWQTPRGHRYRVEACEGHRPTPAGDRATG